MDHSTTELFGAATPVVPKRGINLDLTGLPPTADRLLELLELFAAARYNVVLVQWEDSFPWTVDERFRSPTAYSPEEIERFRDKAAALGLELIPLVQCLGHMETPLSVPGYEHLRELPDNESGLNPLAPGVLATAWSRWAVDTVQCVPIDAALDAVMLGGAILYDGAAPPGGVTACIDALDEVGEKERFLACRDAMARLTELRRRGWNTVMHARQQVTLATMDTRRTSARNPVLGMKPLEHLGGIVKEAEKLAEEIRHCFDGLLQPASIDEYVATRLDPFRQEWTELRARLARPYRASPPSRRT